MRTNDVVVGSSGSIHASGLRVRRLWLVVLISLSLGNIFIIIIMYACTPDDREIREDADASK